MADSAKTPDSFKKFDGSRGSWRLYHINLKALMGRFKLLAVLVLASTTVDKAVKDGDTDVLAQLSLLYSVILATIADTEGGVVLKEWLAGRCEHLDKGYNDGILAYQLLCSKFGVATNDGQNQIETALSVYSLSVCEQCGRF